MSRFRIILLDETEAELAAEILLRTDSLADVATLRAQIALLGAGKIVAGKRGPKGRQVMVVGKSQECGVPLEAGIIFDSAVDASHALGYGSDFVGISLRRALQNGESSVVMRGVELQYVDQIAGRD